MNISTVVIVVGVIIGIIFIATVLFILAICLLLTLRDLFSMVYIWIRKRSSVKNSGKE